MKEDQRSFAELRKIAANQATTIKQQNEILANQNQDLQMKQRQFEIERMQFEAGKHADISHNFLQAADFAIRTLPFWNRGPKAICNRATSILLAIRKETAKHIAMEVLAQKIHNKPIEEVKAETEKVLDGIIGDPQFKEEGAEMEVK